MRKSIKKMVLTRETIRRLDSGELTKIQGGMNTCKITGCISCCDTSTAEVI